MGLLSLLSDKLLLDTVRGLCGDDHWLIGLRGTCKMMSAAIPPPAKYFDSEEMLLDGAARGNVSLCKYALGCGACKYFSMVKAAAKHGRLSTYRLAVDAVPYVSRCLMCQSGPLYELMRGAVKGGNESICKDILTRGYGTPYGRAHWLTTTIMNCATRYSHFDLLYRLLGWCMGTEGVSPVELVSTVPDRSGYFCVNLYKRSMEAYGYYGDEKYRAFALGIMTPAMLSWYHDVFYTDFDEWRELFGYAMSGKYDLFVRLLDKLGSTPDLLLKCARRSLRPGNSNIYQECLKRLGDITEETRCSLLLASLKSDNLRVCEEIVQHDPTLAQEMMRIGTKNREHGLEICEKALSLGAKYTDRELWCAVDHNNTEVCRAILKRGITRTDPGMMTAMKKGYMHIIALIIGYEQKRLNARIKSNQVDEDTAHAFGFISAEMCNEHLAKTGCSDLGEIPLLRALYPDNQYIYRKRHEFVESMLWEGPAYVKKFRCFLRKLKGTKYLAPRSI